MNKNRFFVIPFLLLAFILSSFINIDKDENNDKFVVVLDAGHGGHDPGNLGNGYLEKNIALNIVLKVGSILEQNPDIKVVYTRKDDTFIDLFVRGEIANKANADLFVSVHCDSHTSDAHGAGTFVLGLHANKQNFEIAKKENSVIYLEDNYETRYANYDINSPESVIGLTIMQEEFLDQSISLAKAIQDNFSNKLKRKNREVKQAGFIVLHQTFMPSVLVETGFLTNNDEGAYLNSRKGQVEMGTAVAEAILSYKSNVSSFNDSARNVVTTAPSSTQGVSSSSVSQPAVDKKMTAEEFAKNPGVNPTASVPAVNEVVESTKETVAAVTQNIPSVTQPEVVSVVKEVITPVKTVPQPTSSNLNIEFRVQLMASSKNIPLEPSQFKGLGDLTKEPVASLYRYMHGKVGSYEEALSLKRNADQNGYPSSYIVAYKDGVRISATEARKMVSQ